MAKQQKRKSSEYVSDDGFIANDSDGSDRPAKKSKTTTKSTHFATAATTQIDDEGNQYWEISKSRRVTVSEYKKQKMVSIREYYEKDGKTLPGKKGISMTMEQYSAFIKLLPQIEGALEKKGEHVPRPSYGGGGGAGVKDEDEMEEESNDEEDKKANIDATSDEDEG